MQRFYSLRVCFAVFSVLFLCVTTPMSFAQAQTETTDAAKARLTNNPCDLRALGVLSFYSRTDVAGDRNLQQSLHNLIEYSSRGLNCIKDSVSPPGGDSEKRKLLVIFNGGAGFAALRNKDYARAQSYLRAAVNDDPDQVQNVYPLALAYLQSTPPDSVDGLFFLARAISLAQYTTGQAELRAYAVRMYQNYHGSKEGWDNVLSTAKKNGVPPVGFTITRSPFSHSIAIPAAQREPR